MTQTRGQFLERLACKRAAEFGTRQHVVRFLSKHGETVEGIVEEGDALPNGAVRLFSSPRIGGRKRRAYR